MKLQLLRYDPWLRLMWPGVLANGPRARRLERKGAE